MTPCGEFRTQNGRGLDVSPAQLWVAKRPKQAQMESSKIKGSGYFPIIFQINRYAWQGFEANQAQTGPNIGDLGLYVCVGNRRKGKG
jgi:hypothetical protein